MGSSKHNGVIQLFGELGDVEIERVLSFICVDFAMLAVVTPVDQRLAQISRNSGCWEGASIRVPRLFLEKRHEAVLESLIRLARSSWKLSREVCLPAHCLRNRVKAKIQNAWPALKMTVDGVGPLPFFCMYAEMLQIGEMSGLHLFEPRYRWMCRKLIAAGDANKSVHFGWVSECELGSLCRVSSIEVLPGGTYNIQFVCQGNFEVLDAWEEPVPRMVRAPKLMHGYVEIYEGGWELEGAAFADDEDEEEEDDDANNDTDDESYGPPTWNKRYVLAMAAVFAAFAAPFVWRFLQAFSTTHAQ